MHIILWTVQFGGDFLISDLEKELISSKNNRFYPFISTFDYPWQAVASIGKYAESLIAAIESGNMTLYGIEFCKRSEGVYIANGCSVKIAESALIMPPCVIFPDCEIRSGAYIRGRAVIGRGCVIGNSSEVKNCLFFDSVKIPHFNYVGDSVLFEGAHLGAGAIISNVRCDKANIRVRFRNERFDSGCRKLGAVIGSRCEIGCGCVINPGAFIGKDSVVYPLQSVTGYIPPSSVVKCGIDFRAGGQRS